jgi:hypothetical protein
VEVGEALISGQSIDDLAGPEGPESIRISLLFVPYPYLYGDFEKRKRNTKQTKNNEINEKPKDFVCFVIFRLFRVSLPLPASILLRAGAFSSIRAVKNESRHVPVQFLARSLLDVHHVSSLVIGEADILTD